MTFLSKLLMKIIIVIRGKILDTTFDFIEVCIKNENNEDLIMKDFFQISLYINI